MIRAAFPCVYTCYDSPLQLHVYRKLWLACRITNALMESSWTKSTAIYSAMRLPNWTCCDLAAYCKLRYSHTLVHMLMRSNCTSPTTSSILYCRYVWTLNVQISFKSFGWGAEGGMEISHNKPRRWEESRQTFGKDRSRAQQQPKIQSETPASLASAGHEAALSWLIQ